MRLRVLPDEKFSCHSCGQCCRAGWHIELLEGEEQRIGALVWPQGDPLKGATPFQTFGGRRVLAQKANSACVFLDEETNRCRIHEEFGEAVKPLGCRLFPFHLTPTFRGEASVTARFDCPSVRQNLGSPHAEQEGDLQRYAKAMKLPQDGFDEATRCHLEKEQIEAATEFAGVLLKAFESDDQRALFLLFFASWLSTLKVGDLDRAALGQAFAPLKEMVEASTSRPVPRPGWMQRLAFRTLLALYLRRDEDVVAGRASRFGRALGMLKMALGVGGLRSLGRSHRAGKLRRARLFRPELRPVTPDVAALHWRMIRSKLGSMQFMSNPSPGRPGRDFLAGLCSLALLYPLMLAVAKHSAGNRGASAVEAEDVDYAVMAIEHSYGRLAMLSQPLARQLEAVLLEPMTFVKLVRSV